MQVVINNQIVNYNISGKGKKILILHGWGDNIKSYDNLINELSRNYQVAAVDLPGFGGSIIEEDNYDLSKYAVFIKDFTDKIGYKDLDLLIGHSNGGAIAIKAIAEDKINPKKLVLVASAGIREPESSRLKTLKLITKSAKLITSPLPKSTKSKLRSKLYKNIGSDYLVNENLKNTFKNVVSEDIRKYLKDMKQDTLLIYGDIDEETPFTFGQEFHELLKSSTLEILHGDHFLIHSDPKQIADRIKEFDNEKIN